MSTAIVKNVKTDIGNVNFVRTGDTTRVTLAPCKGVNLVFHVHPSRIKGSTEFVATGYLPHLDSPTDKYIHRARTEEAAYRGFVSQVMKAVKTLQGTSQRAHLRLVTSA